MVPSSSLQHTCGTTPNQKTTLCHVRKMTILDLAQTQIHGVGPWEHVARVGIRGHLARVACRAHYFWFRRFRIRPAALGF